MRFNYLEPKTIEEAVSLLSKYGGKSNVMAGGTDLLVKIGNKSIEPEYVVDIGYVPGLDYINYDDKEGLCLGAMTTIRALENSVVVQERYPVISQAAGLLGSVAIRNVATIGGRMSAKVKIVGPDRERLVPLEDFFTGPGKTVLKRGELLLEVQVPVPLPDTKSVYLKHRRSAVDLATVGVAVIMTLETGGNCKDIKIVLGAVAPTPIRARKAEEILRGKKVEQALIEKSAQVAADEAFPIMDVRASAEYRRDMVEVFTRRSLEQIINKDYNFAGEVI